MLDIVVTIPAYHPMESLAEYVELLLAEGISHVIVIDDANDKSYQAIFEQLRTIPKVTVLRHKENLGKGEGIRTACRYFLSEKFSEYGMVTADADGQHAVYDVIKVARRLLEGDCDYVLGMRRFDGPEVPFRSKLGNWVSMKLFKWLFGYEIRDTQTGLRGWTRDEMSNLIELSGSRFEYEFNMLMMIANRQKSLATVDIETIYHEVHTSNYKTVRDSVRIGWNLFKGYLNKTR